MLREDPHEWDELTEDDDAATYEALDRSRQFLIAMQDPAIAPRLARPANAMKAYLKANGRTPFIRLVTVGWKAGDCLPKTIDGIIRKAIAAGLLSMTGRYRSKHDDTRMVELVDWPEPTVDPLLGKRRMATVERGKGKCAKEGCDAKAKYQLTFHKSGNTRLCCPQHAKDAL